MCDLIETANRLREDESAHIPVDALSEQYLIDGANDLSTPEPASTWQAIVDKVTSLSRRWRHE